jgi:hypothetical protein
MAYIELVDSPTEIGKRIEKRPKVYPTIEELREKAPTMDIYNKPVLHVSENKRTSLLGGMVTLLNRLRTIPIPTVSDLASNLLSPPDLSIEFANLPGPGQPREKEAQEMLQKSIEDIKKHTKEVLERRKIEQKDERVRLRKLLHMDGTRKQRKAATAAAAAQAAEAKGEGEKTQASKEAGGSEATEKEKRPQQSNQQGKQQHKAKPQHGNQHHHAKPQQQHNNKAHKNKNKNHGKKK